MDASGFIRVSLLLAFLVVVGSFAYYRHGRAAWFPVLLRVTGERTTASVVDQLRGRMEERFPQLGALTDGKPIAILGFKAEQRLEVWKEREAGWTKAKEYPFTAMSGKLGPKLRQGDRQIPEGVYEIECLNPNSSYYLSLKITYPNAFDREKGKLDGRTDLGGDIFIHGKSVTIGCIPVGDGAVEEIYFLVAENGISKTRVVISPYDMRAGEQTIEIAEVDWEEELYEKVREALKPFGGEE